MFLARAGYRKAGVVVLAKQIAGIGRRRREQFRGGPNGTNKVFKNETRPFRESRRYTIRRRRDKVYRVSIERRRLHGTTMQ